MVKKNHPINKLPKNICVIIGHPVKHSLSPAMHNAAYQSLKIHDQFLFLATDVKINEVKNTVKAVRVLGVRGLTCTMPHKIEVVKYLDKIDPVAKKIGAVNSVVNRNGRLIGYNTDWIGAITPLEKYGSLKGKKAALLGAGGAARAFAYGLTKKGAKLKIYNEHMKVAKKLAKEFKAGAGDLTQIHELKDCDIIINATPVGMKPKVNASLVPKQFLHKGQIVFDAVYEPRLTRLLQDAKKAGAKIIPGLEMLLYQGVAQFELYTRKKAPVEVMRKVLAAHNK